MIDLIEIITSLLKSLFFGVVLLLIALFSIPESWVIKVLQVIKPSIIKTLFKKNEKYFKAFLSIILSGDYHEDFINDEKGQNLIEKIKTYKKELDKTEENIFIIDLLEELFEMLSFSSTHLSMEAAQDLIENLSNYFNRYTSKLVDTTYRKNFASDILFKFNEMISKMEETSTIESKATKKLRVSYASDFREFLKYENEELYKTRDSIKDNLKLTALQLIEISK